MHSSREIRVHVRVKKTRPKYICIISYTNFRRDGTGGEDIGEKYSRKKGNCAHVRDSEDVQQYAPRFQHLPDQH